MDNEAATVLAIDDEPGLTDLYDAWLQADYRVLTAGDGEIGLEKLEEAVDVVVLDRDMPTMSGDEFLRRCRRSGWDCRVLMVTGAEPDGDVLDLGFDAYLVKPIERQMLRDNVAMLLRRQRYSDDVKEFFAISSKLAVVDEDVLENGGRERFERLLERREALRREVDHLLDGFDQSDVEATYRQLPAEAD